MRTVHGQPPAATGVQDGLAWARFEPAGTPSGTALILHGADSCKENYFQTARGYAAGGLAALTFDTRGHGASEGALGAGALDDVLAMANLARQQAGGADAVLTLHGSSMGGYFALIAAGPTGASTVVAVCPAPGEQLARGLAAGVFGFRADVEELSALLRDHDLHDAVASLNVPLLLMHARGDGQVSVEHSQELARVAPDCRYLEVPGGHHRSIQQDAELQGAAVRFVARAIR